MKAGERLHFWTLLKQNETKQNNSNKKNKAIWSWVQGRSAVNLLINLFILLRIYYEANAAMYWSYAKQLEWNEEQDIVPFPQETHSLVEHEDKTISPRINKLGQCE